MKDRNGRQASPAHVRRGLSRQDRAGEIPTRRSSVPRHESVEKAFADHAAPRRLSSQHTQPQHVSSQHVSPQHVASEHAAPKQVRSHKAPSSHKAPPSHKALAQQGIEIDVSKIKPEDLEGLVQHLTELQVDVDGNDGEKVRVFCE